MKNTLLYPVACCCALLILLILIPERASAQRQVVQLSGLVVAGDSAAGMVGVAIFVPNSNRGTQTNRSGFFSLPVLPGDSVVVAALGYQKQYLLIPETFTGDSYSTLLHLLESPSELPTVDVMPWATERELREAISKVKIVEEQEPQVNLGPLEQKDLTKMRAMDAETNARYGLAQTGRQQQRRYMVPSDIKLTGISIGTNKKASRDRKKARKASKSSD
ncbi:peptidase associated/transthyretin-like domain-containing protein [Pontibacter mangrovi]|uniref:Carboxypeptidase-like regulatory domain-containing protein n=1 Tax=Pontibacter mangrovi TaxID=2589816 RepID=A0A501W865_9BACT|nr:carboxypeptidase-like regulatory domain-containing protein [Pontibacter mangrovi]TPE44735.1 carboxypeptidase-like regulatory domain-containing protein [Pontibacter mangrovi]